MITITPEIEKQLEAEGWIVECESPLEISHEESESFAKGMAADTIIREAIGELVWKKKKKKKTNFKNYSKDINEASNQLFAEYKEILEDEKTIIREYPKTKQELIEFCEVAIKTKMSPDKKSRWLGFLQGVLISDNLITVEEEREKTRPIFQEIYKNNNIKQSKVDS